MESIEILPFTGHDGERLYYRRLIPPAPRAGVLLVHGYSGHSGRYQHLMASLGEAGFATFCPDHRGHGLSGRLLGLIERMEDVVQDLVALRAQMEEALPEVPVFILGHSLGGLLAVLTLGAGAKPLRGAVLSAPAVVSPTAVPWVMKALARSLGKSFPTLGVRSYFDPAKAARSEAAQRSMLEDKLFYKGKVRARTAAEILDSIDRAEAVLSQLELPLLILHGGADQVVPVDASQAVYDRAPSTDKTLRIYEDAYHQMFNDPEWEQILGEIVAWMDARI